MRSVLLAAYHLASALAEPAAPPLLRWRRRLGKEDPARIAERRGRPSRTRPPGPLVWLHGASVGEAVALLPLVSGLTGRGLHVLVTTGTVNSARVMAGRLPPGATHQFVPLDVPRYVERFLDAWRPDLVLLAESELWPNLVRAVARRAVPLGLVNARMSARSHGRWRLFGGAAAALLAPFDLCMAQTEADADRFRDLGARDVRLAGNVKFDVAPPPARPEEVADAQARIGDRPVWVAASTHADEEALLVEAHQLARRSIPHLLTVIVPRQPHRGPALAERAAKKGLATARRAAGGRIGPEVDVYIADTIGEIGLFYRLASLVFLGRSLVPPGGGQNPIEPAKLGCAVLHGPFVSNFADVYALLDAAGGAQPVTDARDLADALEMLLADGAALRAIARAAAEAVEAEAGATARILAAIEPFLAPLRS